MSGARAEDSQDRAVAAGGTPQAPSSNLPARTGADVGPTRAQVWLARSAFGAAFAAVAVLVGFAGLRSLSMVLLGVVGVVVFVAAVYWFLAKRGVLRWAAATLAVAALIAVLVLYLRAQLVWVALLSLACVVLAGMFGRAALSVDAADQSMPTDPARPVKHPFLVMNPRSGGGKVTKFGLKEKAEAMGAEVALLDGPDIVDVAALARDAVDVISHDRAFIARRRAASQRGVPRPEARGVGRVPRAFRTTQGRRRRLHPRLRLPMYS